MRKSRPVTLSAGCATFLKFLMELGVRRPTGSIDGVVAYQDACHLQHAQGIRQQPRDLLAMIPGITFKTRHRIGTVLRSSRKLQSDSAGHGLTDLVSEKCSIFWTRNRTSSSRQTPDARYNCRLS